MLTLYTIVVIAFLFGITIFVHELGHFLVARWLGMVIETFSIGFGPALWKRKVGDITYKVGLIPFGGYVALPQMDPTGEGKSEAGQTPVPPAPPGHRMLVALAGVAGNMILAVLIAWIVYLGGQSYAPAEESGLVGYVDPESEVYAAGLRIGDAITAVNDQPVRSWDDFLVSSALYESPVLRVRAADGAEKSIPAATEKFMGARYVPGLLPMTHCWVLSVDAGSSADKAGIKAGDRIVELDGVRLFSREHLMIQVAACRDRTVPAVIERQGAPMTLEVTPAWDEKTEKVRIGVVFNTLDVKRPMAQIKSHALLIVRLLRALVTPGQSKAAAQAVGGPVAIFGMFWLYVQGSFLMALWFTGLLNVNLAVLNILPIPILDGGHLLFALWEAVTRRKISPRVFNVIMNVFASLLIALFILLVFRDTKRMILPLFRGDAAAEAATNGAPAAADEPAGEPAGP
ncbi:MAG TPA: RIP metalloprotease RseP [Kiritimatiellia bacterium]|nr:RIP metalloprotease RseP [Kiritimatiellia bacterium]HRZ13126.1 RIP metalloprotease RseP [Kiritimatiellia bacterium]HSA17547.1 RIP metalloprotease RseP [Kiritimatiellia bacterium]